MPPKETTPAPKAAATGAARFSFGGGAPKCKTCAKSVYENEKVVYDQVVYHTECFKCKKCTNRIPLVNVAMIAGDLYCKPCFKKIFAEKGTYSSFGEKTVPKWSAEEAKKRGSMDGPHPTPAPAKSAGGAGTIAEEHPKEEAKDAHAAAAATTSPSADAHHADAHHADAHPDAHASAAVTSPPSDSSSTPSAASTTSDDSSHVSSPPAASPTTSEASSEPAASPTAAAETDASATVAIEVAVTAEVAATS
jgi:hypothetical protein